MTVITQCPLDSDENEIFKMAKKDPVLINAINDYVIKLASDGIETFNKRDNIAITEDGYYLAFHDHDLIHAK